MIGEKREAESDFIFCFDQYSALGPFARPLATQPA